MIFSLHGGSAEEGAALKRLAERLRAGSAVYEALEQMTQWLDRDPPSKMAAGAQDPLPGLETPPCR